MSDDLPSIESKVVKLAPLAGIALLVVGGLAGLAAPADALQAYHTAYAYWWTLGVGGLALAALHQLVSGRWGLCTSRAFEATARTLPFLGLLFVPVLLWPEKIFPWVGAEDLGNKAVWLNVSGLRMRAVGYFVVWTILAFGISAWSVARDKERKKGQRDRLIKLGAGSLLLFVLTTSFASLDWYMSLEPDWYSTIYGALYVIDAGILALSLGILIAWLRSGDDEVAEFLTPEAWADLGNLLMAFTMVWAYFNFSQFLIIWSADLPVESVWYLKRAEGAWLFWANLNVLLQFFVPFLVLLSPDVRGNPTRLAFVALFVLGTHFVSNFWSIAPAFGEGRWGVWLLSWVMWAGLGGLWLGLFGWQLGRHPILPVNDPAADRHRQRVANGHGHHEAPTTQQTEATT